MEHPFGNDRKIRLGIWGLGRGAHFFKMCADVNLDVVAGCDHNKIMRDEFLDDTGNSFVTADSEEFLNSDIEAVLLATHCPDHAEHAIRCLEAGKHVLSEVTAFETPAQGVKLLEAVESSGLVYNLAENYPFTKARLYLAEKWKQGLFGDLIYGENEYNHDSRRPLSFKYLNGEPVRPGWSLHAWRSWQHQHFYCTHSLGPLMHITGGRARRVVSLPGQNSMAGNVSQVRASRIATVAPSMLEFDNGGVVRNLMGSTTNDTHQLRLWGTRGSAELNEKLFLRLGGKGDAPKMEVLPSWPELATFAESAGHGGGDFWTLYYFAREILHGEPAFWDVYRSCDVTLPGIFAYRSAVENGIAFDIPDFRDKVQRDSYRNDASAQERYDWRSGPFGDVPDKDQLEDFTALVTSLIDTHATGPRAVIDWLSVKDTMVEPGAIRPILEEFVSEHAHMKETFQRAREIIKQYSQTDGAQILREMLDLADADRVERDEFLADVKRELEGLSR